MPKVYKGKAQTTVRMEPEELKMLDREIDRIGMTRTKFLEKLARYMVKTQFHMSKDFLNFEMVEDVQSPIDEIKSRMDKTQDQLDRIMNMLQNGQPFSSQPTQSTNQFTEPEPEPRFTGRQLKGGPKGWSEHYTKEEAMDINRRFNADRLIFESCKSNSVRNQTQLGEEIDRHFGGPDRRNFQYLTLLNDPNNPETMQFESRTMTEENRNLFDPYKLVRDPRDEWLVRRLDPSYDVWTRP